MVSSMIPIGYMYKNVTSKPTWIEVNDVVDIFSVSHCTSHEFTDYINYWQHNGYWFFNSPEIMQSIAQNNAIDLSKATLLYYEAYKYEYCENSKEWASYSAESSFITDVEEPKKKELVGYDVVTFSVNTSPECSPLSCNYLAKDTTVNSHCLFNSFIEAKNSLEAGFFNDSECGPFRIFSVYKVS